ncbi:hypothetical protein AB0D08_06825 [Kitasatospora sp. NPDC048540]|uniref:hypothetical protein n=1 Tax=Kitasatospora sp. NPDC048540 TaxID=3155634 RepID=UPI0033C34CAF
MKKLSLDSIDAIIGSGKAVISADDSGIVAAVQQVAMSGRSATFYVSRAQAAIIREWYWTPRRIRERGLEPVSPEEKAQIHSELGIQETGTLYSNRIQCTCGSTYGAFEFVQQGIREHGREALAEVLALETASVIRVNPVQVAVCPGCNREITPLASWTGWRVSHEYEMVPGYGCCRPATLEA